MTSSCQVQHVGAHGCEMDQALFPLLSSRASTRLVLRRRFAPIFPGQQHRGGPGNDESRGDSGGAGGEDGGHVPVPDGGGQSQEVAGASAEAVGVREGDGGERGRSMSLFPASPSPVALRNGWIQGFKPYFKKLEMRAVLLAKQVKLTEGSFCYDLKEREEVNPCAA